MFKKKLKWRLPQQSRLQGKTYSDYGWHLFLDAINEAPLDEGTVNVCTERKPDHSEARRKPDPQIATSSFFFFARHCTARVICDLTQATNIPRERGRGGDKEEKMRKPDVEVKYYWLIPSKAATIDWSQDSLAPFWTGIVARTGSVTCMRPYGFSVSDELSPGTVGLFFIRFARVKYRFKGLSFTKT